MLGTRTRRSHASRQKNIGLGAPPSDRPLEQKPLPQDGMPLFYFLGAKSNNRDDNDLNLTWSTSLESYDSYSAEAGEDLHRSLGAATVPSPSPPPSSLLARRAVTKIKQRRGGGIEQQQQPRQGNIIAIPTAPCNDGASQWRQRTIADASANANGGTRSSASASRLPSTVMKYMKKCEGGSGQGRNSGEREAADLNKATPKSRRHRKIKALARARREEKEAREAARREREEEEQRRREELRQVEALARARARKQHKDEKRRQREEEERRQRYQQRMKEEEQLRLRAKKNDNGNNNSSDSNRGSDRGLNPEQVIIVKDGTSQHHHNGQAAHLDRARRYNENDNQQHASSATAHSKTFMDFVEHLLIEKAVLSGNITSEEQQSYINPLSFAKVPLPSPTTEQPSTIPTKAGAATADGGFEEEGEAKGRAKETVGEEEGEACRYHNAEKFRGGPDLPKPVLRRFPTSGAARRQRVLLDAASNEGEEDGGEGGGSSVAGDGPALEDGDRGSALHYRLCLWRDGIAAKVERDLEESRCRARATIGAREEFRAGRERRGAEEEEDSGASATPTPSVIEF